MMTTADSCTGFDPYHKWLGIAMASRDLQKARLLLESACSAANSSPRGKEPARRVQALCKAQSLLEIFWSLVRREVSRATAGEELTVADEVVAVVVESGEDGLLVRWKGQNLRYLPEQLPCELAVALAERGLVR